MNIFDKYVKNKYKQKCVLNTYKLIPTCLQTLGRALAFGKKLFDSTQSTRIVELAPGCFSFIYSAFLLRKKGYFNLVPKIFRLSVTFLVIVYSSKPLDVATSNLGHMI